MDRITVDFAKKVGPIKPMHSVNNGPVYKFAADQRITNLEHFQAAGIPYVRTHDASIDYNYGAEHVVDVNGIFPDFTKDPTDPASYDFEITDEYMKIIALGGSKVFYRLGSRIEHWSKKYNTLPPPDFHKWAVICEHIIRHYNEGWANGFEMGIEYWEIWNEPDLDSDDSKHKRTWGGTAKDFYELWAVTLKHLKKCFPNLKIGGPACSGVKPDWMEGLYNVCDTAPDFFSWHVYGKTVEKVRDKIRMARKWLDDHGWTATESILNEWNYIRGWLGDDWYYSLKMEKALKGSSFIAATMLMSQYEPLDNLMYYDARPCQMNGMFNTDFVCERLKGYYPFYMFNQLYRQESAVEIERDSEDVWAAAAVGEEQNAMIAYYNEDDNAPAKQVEVAFKNVKVSIGVRAELYCLDADHDAELVRTENITSPDFSLTLNMPLHSTYLIKLINL